MSLFRRQPDEPTTPPGADDNVRWVTLDDEIDPGTGQPVTAEEDMRRHLPASMGGYLRDVS